MLKRYKVQIPSEFDQFRLDHALAKLLPEVSRSWIRKMIVQGAVYVNRKRVRVASRKVFVKSVVEVLVKGDSETRRSIESKWKEWELSPERVLYEDDFLIVVDKPAGLPTQPTLDEARTHLVEKVQAYLKKKDPQAYLGIHHRLDRDTSGVILFTKNRSINSDIAKIFAEHQIQKTYEAIAMNSSKKTMALNWVVENFLGPISKKGKAKKMGEVHSGGLRARTEFRLIDQWPHQGVPQWIWIEAKPFTGRMHQIRVHCSESGIPLVGDYLYGGKIDEAPRLLLHARRIQFRHPRSLTPDSLLSIEAPVPEDFQSFWKQVQK